MAWTLDLTNPLTECAVHSALSNLRVIMDQCQTGCNSVWSKPPDIPPAWATGQGEGLFRITKSIHCAVTL
jgi:hypothetical protein